MFYLFYYSYWYGLSFADSTKYKCVCTLYCSRISNLRILWHVLTILRSDNVNFSENHGNASWILFLTPYFSAEILHSTTIITLSSSFSSVITPFSSVITLFSSVITIFLSYNGYNRMINCLRISLVNKIIVDFVWPSSSVLAYLTYIDNSAVSEKNMLFN